MQNGDLRGQPLKNWKGFSKKTPSGEPESGKGKGSLNPKNTKRKGVIKDSKKKKKRERKRVSILKRWKLQKGGVVKKRGRLWR